MAKVVVPTFNEGEEEIAGIELGRSRVVMVPVANLEVDPHVQRDHLDYRKIETIKRHFNEDSLGIVTVSERRTPNGTVIARIILDGWHRQVAVKELTENQGEMLCRVFKDLTPQEESWIFLQLNAGNQPNLLDKFRQRLRADEPTAVAIDEITKSFGLVVEAGGNTGQIQCVGALQKVYLLSIKHEFEPNLLDLTLRAITNAWGAETQGTQGVIVEGIALFLAKHGQRVDYEFFIDKLKNYKGGAITLHTNARANAATRGSRVPHSVADLLTDWYNKGNKRAKLPVWASR
jgi:hypothetical protein